MAERAPPRPATAGLIRPMLATAGPVPVGPGWAFEVKFDGVRAIGYAGGGGLTLYSRNDRDISRSYPEIAALDIDHGVVVDGELVALDQQGRPDFGLLQQRMHITTPTVELIGRVPVQYVVFDLLRRGDRSLLEEPYSRRRERLDRLGLERPGLRVPANFTDITGDVVMAAVAQQGLEGVVAKRLVSTYQPGRRSRAWIKTPIRHSAEVIIAGWSPSSGNATVLSALLLAAHTATASWSMSGMSAPGSPTPLVATSWTCCSPCTATPRRSPGRSSGPAAGRDAHRPAASFSGWRRGWSGRSNTGRSP